LGCFSLVGIEPAGTKFCQFGFERQVTIRVRLVSVKRCTDIRDFHKGGENLAWIWRAAFIKNVTTYPRPMYAADLSMMHISDHRRREPNFGFRECGWIGE